MSIIEVLGQLGNALRIGFGFEFEALSLQKSLQFFVIGDDAVMDD
jgi:hypothetical protein